MQQALTVTQVNRYIKNMFLTDQRLNGLSIHGEISNFVNHVRSGHFYFTIKDETSALKCVMFRSNAIRLRFMPENGMRAVVQGDIQVFERDGIYQLYCTDIQPDGVGALYLAYEQTKQRLEKEGLFAKENKRPLPRYPQRIGVVTSKTGAALQDILHVLRRRYPVAEAVLIPALVQGAEAVPSVCAALRTAGNARLDVLLLVRGGGSLEDLWCFNDERVARAIRACPVPVVTGVGHEIDFTIADFAADLRAPTPTAAAELATPDAQVLQSQLQGVREYLQNTMRSEIDYRLRSLADLENRLHLLSPRQMLLQGEERLSGLHKRLHLAGTASYTNARQRYTSTLDKLETLNPLSVLKRGYAAVFDQADHLISTVSRLPMNQPIQIRMQDGTATAKVTEIYPK